MNIPAYIVGTLDQIGFTFPVTIQPASEVVVSGANVAFTISPTNSSSPFNYQWRYNGTNISNATNLTLQLKAVTTNNTGNYDAVLFNGNSSIASAIASLIVYSPVQTFTNLYSFTAVNYNMANDDYTNSEGFSPRSVLVSCGSFLYGTATEGGSANNGSVFRVNTDGTGFTNLHSFTAGSGKFPTLVNGDGAWPVAGLLALGNTLYGTTEAGGNSGNGTVFRLNVDGTGFTNLHSFASVNGTSSSNLDGAWPQGGLILAGSTLYGTSEYGGSFGFGTVFSLNTNGTGFTNIYSFTGGNDGAYPVSGMILSGGVLFGSAYEGGSADAGTLFSVDTNGTGFTSLYNFTDGNDGAGPQASLILIGNTLYGTASQGGASENGSLFAINTNGTDFTNLYSFTGGNDGADPVSGLLLSRNTLYGTAEEGGNSDDGTVFMINKDGSGFKTLHSFTGYPNDGAYPMCSLAMSGNTLYGTAESGGSWDCGSIFSLVLSSTTPPQLTITSSGANIILSWPGDATGFTLQSTTNLTSVPTWSTASPAPTIVNGQSIVTNSISSSQMFYRLSQ